MPKVAKPKSAYTKEVIHEKLANSPKFVEWALLTLYANQTADEQNAKTTEHHNGVGFNGTDAKFLSDVAEQVQRKTGKLPVGQRMSVKQSAAVGKCLRKYWGQLQRAMEAAKPTIKQEAA